MKKILCVIVLVLTVSCCAFGDEAVSKDISGVSSFMIQRDMGNSTGFRTSDGLQVVYLGTFRAEPSDTNTISGDAAQPDEGIFSTFMVKSDRDTQTVPTMRKTIGGTTYIVTAHFSETSKETMSDKICRMIKRDIESGNY